MRFYELSLLIFLGIGLLCFLTGLLSVKYLGSDNKIETVAEEVLQEETGVKVDLSPDSQVLTTKT